MNEAEEFSSTYIINIIVNVFLCYTAIMLDSITIHVIRKTSSLPKPLKTLLDYWFTLKNIASLAMNLKQNTENKTSFSGTNTAFFIIATFLSYSSFFGVLALTVDTFLAIHLYLRYQEFVTHKRRAVAVVVSIMVLSSLLLSLVDARKLRRNLYCYRDSLLRNYCHTLLQDLFNYSMPQKSNSNPTSLT